jgi:hypothetical protein
MFEKIQKIKRIKDKNNWKTIAINGEIEKKFKKWLKLAKNKNKMAKDQIVKDVNMHRSFFLIN